jgi:hypothetical protein
MNIACLPRCHRWPLLHSTHPQGAGPGVTSVIPPKANRKDKRECDFVLYCERNLIERFFNKESTSAASQRGTTNLRGIISPQFSWLLLSSCSTEDTP